MLITEQIFNGFSPLVKSFFENLKQNNNREWFAENKYFYDNEIKEQSKKLVSDMAARFASLGLPYVADPSVSLFRIYRDIRFSKNKDPYKTNLGILFPFMPQQINARAVESPGLYFQIDAIETFIAGGIHMPDPAALRLIRTYISDNWEEFDLLVKDKYLVEEFPSILRDAAGKTVPRGFDPTHPGSEIFKLKGFSVSSPLTFEDITQPYLCDILERKAVVIAPFLNFLFKAIYFS